jgi:hypothetical protein
LGKIEWNLLRVVVEAIQGMRCSLDHSPSMPWL